MGKKTNFRTITVHQAKANVQKARTARRKEKGKASSKAVNQIARERNETDASCLINPPEQ